MRSKKGEARDTKIYEQEKPERIGKRWLGTE